MRSAVFSVAYLISGAILLACDILSNGGYCGMIGTIFLGVGVLISVWKPIKTFFQRLYEKNAS